MRSLIRLVFAATALVPAVALRAADERYSLSPRFAAGQTYITSWSLSYQATKSVMGLNELANDSRWTATGSATVTVIEARDGAPRKMTVAFGECRRSEPSFGMDMKPVQKSADFFYTKRTVQMELGSDAFTGEPKLVMTEGGREAHSELIKAVQLLVLGNVMPRDPLAVGANWDVADLQSLLGPTAKGTAAMRLVKVERQGQRNIAQVQADGKVQQEPPNPILKQSGMDKDSGINATFTGTIQVDADSGVIVAADLKGPGTMKQAAATLEGTWSYQRRLGALDQEVVAANDPKKPKTYHEKKGYFSLAVPPGWNPVPIENGVSLHNQEHQGMIVGETVVNVEITADPAKPMADLKELAAAVRATVDLAKNQPVVKIQIQEEGPIKLGNQDGVACDWSEDALDHRKRHLIAGTLAGRTAVVFTATVRGELFDKVSPDLKAIRQSLVIHNPPQPPPPDADEQKKAPKPGKVTDW